MSKTAAEIMKEYVRSQNFTSTDEIMAAMKDMFKDVLQEVMECELSEELGYERTTVTKRMPRIIERVDRAAVRLFGTIT